MRPPGEPNVLAAGAELVTRLMQRNDRLAHAGEHPAGAASVFVGQFHGGEIYNQYPQESWLEGTRRWLPVTSRSEVEQEFRQLLDDLARETRTTIVADFRVIRDAFELNPGNPLVAAFQAAQETISGRPLPTGPKAFVDDGNSFCGSAGIPAITHGPRSGGQHTGHEWVSVADLERVAHLYALTAAKYCSEASAGHLLCGGP
jgi:acetylornithine deacetylase/succinyl-diaminopimelate desuccinylase-like protein